MATKAAPAAVKARALALTSADGNWFVIGHPDWTDDELIEDALELFGDGEMRHYWIEMELELPNQ